MSSNSQDKQPELEEELQNPGEAAGLAGAQLCWSYDDPPHLCFGSYSSSSSSARCMVCPNARLRRPTAATAAEMRSDPLTSPRAVVVSPGDPNGGVNSSSRREGGAQGPREEEEEEGQGGRREEARAGAGQAASRGIVPIGEEDQDKMLDLVTFLISKYHARESVSQAEMVNKFVRDQPEEMPLLLSQARDCMQLVFGIDVKEVDPQTHSYTMAPVLGLTYDGMTDDEDSKPKTGLLVMVLGVIALENNCATEENMWDALGTMGVYAGDEHYIYGEPRDLLTRVWVRGQYLQYKRVPGSRPPRRTFLWGPRAHRETTREEVLGLLLRVNRRRFGFLQPFLGILREGDPEMGGQPRSRQGARGGPPSL